MTDMPTAAAAPETSGTQLAQTLQQIVPVDETAREASETRQLDLTKPPGSLGRLETLGNQLSAIAGSCPPPVPEPALLCIFAGDHGVHAQGVSPWPQEVTIQMVANMLNGGAGGNVLARTVGADVAVIDVATMAPLDDPRLVNRHLAFGTADLSRGPAMTREQAVAALEVGIDMARTAVADGYRVLLPGEVGIGNTTAAAALIAVFTGRPAAEVTGSGAGAYGDALVAKAALIARAIEERGVTADDPVAALAEVGGFEHAAIAGLLLGAAAERVPVILDGVIACASALVAVALCPAVRGYLIAGHLGAEPGIAAAASVLELTPVVGLDMRLGEGTGAALALPIVQASARVLREMATFSSAGVSGSE